MIGSLIKQATTETATRTLPSKRLMNRTMNVYVRHKSLYIPLPSSAKQRERAEFYFFFLENVKGGIFGGTFLGDFDLKLNAGVTQLA